MPPTAAPMSTVTVGTRPLRLGRGKDGMISIVPRVTAKEPITSAARVVRDCWSNTP